MVVATTSSFALAQRTAKKPNRAAPPTFKPGEFSGIFFDDAISQLQGERPTQRSPSDSQMAASSSSSPAKIAITGSEETESEANGEWKSVISDATIEDLVKEAKSRLDQTISTPAKFASGGFIEARREFTLLATMMAIINEYPDTIRWKNSADYGHRIFARMAANCKVGTQPAYNEAKLRLGDLQEMLKGAPIRGTADEVTWETTADRGPLMQLLEWSLREHLAPSTRDERAFQDDQEEVLKYAELIAAYGHVLRKEGMTDADDETYAQFSADMTSAANDVAKAAKLGDADGARAAVGRIDQACSKCHESYR